MIPSGGAFRERLLFSFVALGGGGLFSLGGEEEDEDDVEPFRHVDTMSALFLILCVSPLLMLMMDWRGICGLVSVFPLFCFRRCMLEFIDTNTADRRPTTVIFKSRSLPSRLFLYPLNQLSPP